MNLITIPQMGLSFLIFSSFNFWLLINYWFNFLTVYEVIACIVIDLRKLDILEGLFWFFISTIMLSFEGKSKSSASSSKARITFLFLSYLMANSICESSTSTNYSMIYYSLFANYYIFPSKLKYSYLSTIFRVYAFCGADFPPFWWIFVPHNLDFPFSLPLVHTFTKVYYTTLQL